MTVHAGIEALDRLHAEMEKGEVDHLFDRIGVIIAMLKDEVDAPDFVVIEDDPEPSLATNYDNLVVLQMTAYRAVHNKPAEIVDSLCDIDFFETSSDWVRGTYYRVSEIPEACTHLREIARDMHLPE